jgi:hypothetical protein
MNQPASNLGQQAYGFNTVRDYVEWLISSEGPFAQYKNKANEP